MTITARPQRTAGSPAPADDGPTCAIGGKRLTSADFERLAGYIFASSGIKMPRNKALMLEGRLQRRVRATGMADLAAYCDYAFAGANLGVEGVHLLNAVTTNTTEFFRERHHFDFIRETALPDLLRAGARRIRAWSAGCSIGAEAYTLAMTLDDFASPPGSLPYRILATDIDTEVLTAARTAIYPCDMIETVPEPLRRRYVMAARNPDRCEMRIVPALRSAMSFARLNLMDECYPVGETMHLIFCRNTLIYFDKPTQLRVLRQLIDCLRPGGYLFLGHSESIAGLDLPLQQMGNTVFRRDRA